MNRQNFTTRIGGALLGLIAALAIGAAVGGRAQAQSDDPRINKDSRNSDSLAAQRYRESELHSLFNGLHHSYMTYGPVNRSLEAKLKVTNHSSNEIRFVSWVVSFTDPTTGAVVRTREVTSKSRIAPGKEKTLKKIVAAPRLVNVRSVRGKTYTALPKMTTALARVTYADGTTSQTP